MKKYKLVLVAFFIGIVIFIGFKYVLLIKEKYMLEESVNMLQKKVDHIIGINEDLKQEVAKGKAIEVKLQQDNAVLQNDLEEVEANLTRLDQQLAETKDALDQLGSNFSLLKEENKALKAELVQADTEKTTLMARLGSAVELKKALKELKKQARKVIVSIRNKTQSKPLSEGNRGYMLKQGKPTYPARLKINVEPAPARP